MARFVRSPACQSHGFNVIHIRFRIQQPCTTASVSVWIGPYEKHNNSSPLAKLEHVYAIKHVN